MHLKLSIFLLLAVISCKPAKKHSLVGNWAYEKPERVDGMPIDLANPVKSELHESNRGLVMYFSETIYMIKSFKDSTNGEMLSTGEYFISGDRKILQMKSNKGTTVNFIVCELTETLFKLSTDDRGEDCLVFRKYN